MLRFSISSSSLQSSISTVSMSSSRFNARGRRPWHRGFCHRPPSDGGGGDGDHPFVSGDAHLNTVRDANYRYRQGYGGNYSIPRGSFGQDYHRCPPPQFHPNPRPQFHPNAQPNPRPQFRPHPQQHRPDDHRNWVYAGSRPPPQCGELLFSTFRSGNFLFELFE